MVNGSTVATPQTVDALLDAVCDPEIPVLTIRDLGILRDVVVKGNTVEVVITPTYSACPAMAQIEQDVQQVLRDAGYEPRVRTQLSPAWTTDWISAAAREKMRAFGIAAPHTCASGSAGGRRVIPIAPINIANSQESTLAKGPFDSDFEKIESIACPQCGSNHTEAIAPFGSTACKALYRCLDCREAFDYFKPY